jgi:thiamine pyrophosphate-dependent acetolactate synthase large subunit-like protein
MLVAEKTSTETSRSSARERRASGTNRSIDYVKRGPSLTPIRPEYLVATLDRLAADDAFFSVDTGTPCIWAARYLQAGAKRSIFGSFTWASMANAAPNAMGAAGISRPSNDRAER